jgi:threonine synthase
MDILISSNLERLLYHLAGAEAVAGWMAELAEKRRFTVDRGTFARIGEFFTGDWVSNDESLTTIVRVHEETGYLMDPHTAVAWEVAERTKGENPVLVVSTAHWAKFGADVYKALRGLPYGDALPPDAAAMTGLELLDAVRAMAPSADAVPAPLSALAGATERFTSVTDAGRDGIETAVREWLAR